MADKKYREIGIHYADCLRLYGDTHLGVDWPTRDGAMRRYDVMIEFIAQQKVEGLVKVLDFGCGLSGLWERIVELGLDDGVEYTGIDINQGYVDLSLKKFPNNQYFCIDILDNGAEAIGQYDYILLNGLFTQKMSLDDEAMLNFLEEMLVKVFAHSRIGLQFNCMSPLVDYKKDGAFHLSFDLLSHFIVTKLSRKFVIRHDILPYEYFCSVYK